ncbi:MAG: phosphotransferase [Bacteroidaceae bacterium]|nr:phosphotransferase [Bacteroidaceae bacterium]
MNNRIKDLFFKVTGAAAVKSVQLTPAGSNRMYYRLFAESGLTLVGVEGTSEQENMAYFEISKHFRKQNLAVPELLAVSEDGLCYIIEDLGDISLYDLLSADRKSVSYSEESVGILETVMRTLPDLQFKGADGLDFSRCYPSESFDLRMIKWDLNYFKYCFFKAVGIEFNESELEDDFDSLTAILLENSEDFGNTFMYRDFQSRNVMIKDGAPWFIDYQGGRKGPVEYDVASFLWQARASYPDELRNHLVDVYLQAVQKYRVTDKERFLKRLSHFVLFRTLQVLGAYGFRGYFEHKAQFIQSIPAAMVNLRKLLQNPMVEYPYLKKLLQQLVDLPRFAETESPNDKLTVKVQSFSYRKGIPQDESGNGGGFVFDCRYMHNPGLYDEYKQQYGVDKPVIDFLEERGEIQKFLQNVYGIVEPAVEKYLKRGFTNLMISFGCTGGRHRSVYSAQHTAEYLHGIFGDKVRVELIHRELGYTEIL